LIKIIIANSQRFWYTSCKFELFVMLY
jgi:hypothetical protein